MVSPFTRRNEESSLYFNCIKPDYDTRSLSRAIEEGRITEEDVDLISWFLSERKTCSVEFFFK